VGRVHRVRFGAFEIDLRSGELRRHGAKIRLQPQPLRILTLLLERRGEIVTRDQLRRELWPADTFVDFDHGLNSAVRKLRSVLGDSAGGRRLIETRSKLGYRLAVRVDEMEERHIHSVAVLPFQNLDGNVDSDFFAEGMTDELITMLAKIGSLKVISRTSVMCYRGSHKSIAEVGRELRVDAIVEGTVRRSGSRVRVNAQLVDAVTESHVWAESFENEIGDILYLQTELASAVASSIKGQLTERDRAGLGKARPVASKAYEAYLRGRHAWGKGTAENLRRSALHFQQAIDEDPTYPLAYVGLADSYLVRAFYSVLAPRYAYPRARAAALKALELDDTLGEAFASLGNVQINFDWDWKGAERSYARALTLAPGYATAHQWSGQLPCVLGRFEEAIRAIQRAQELDPLSLRIASMVGWTYYFARSFERARDHLQLVVEQAPDSAMSRLWLGQVWQQLGAWQPAITALQEAAAMLGSNLCLGFLASAFAGAGFTERARALVAEMRQMDEMTRHFPAYALAEAHAALGDRDWAFAYLRKACAQREPLLLFIGVEPRMDALRDDPRFGELLAAVGLPPGTARGS
jgi:TolB-like protein